MLATSLRIQSFFFRATFAVAMVLAVASTAKAADFFDGLTSSGQETARLKYIYNTCLRVDFSSSVGSIQTNTNYRPFSNSIETAVRAATYLPAFVDYGIEESLHALNYLRSDEAAGKEAYKVGANAADYEWIKSQMMRKADKEKLEDFQKVCLAQCISSKIIEYDQGWKLTQSPQAAIENGKGVCREYSWIASELMSQMGVPANREFVWYYDTDTSSAHSIVNVKIRGKHYFVEPQEDSCGFYSTQFQPHEDTKVTGGFQRLNK
jgi:hypothetical protein